MFYIDSLKLNNFRCYSNKTINFSPTINIIYGENASGKTTILESLAYLGILKSFRDAKDVDLIKNGEDFFFISAKIKEDEDKNTDLVVSYNNKGKNIKKNSYIYQKNSDYIGYFNVISFDPTDLEMIKGAPQVRRKFLNINISQIDKAYMLSLMKYNKILKKRNEYLKNNDKNSIDLLYLDTITKMLTDEAKIIIKKRREFIDKINGFISSNSLSLTKNKEDVRLVYNPQCEECDVEKESKNRQSKDILLKTTTFGPHRDDVMVYINDKEASIYASQGQTRTCVIAIKLGLSEYMININNKQIVLLDDVFSELDNSRQDELLKVLSDKCQIFITSTGVDHINQTILSKSNLIEFRKEEKV